MRLEADATAFRRLDTIMGLICGGFALAAVWTCAGGLIPRFLICCALMAASAWHACGTVAASRHEGAISMADARAAVSDRDRDG